MGRFRDAKEHLEFNYIIMELVRTLLFFLLLLLHVLLFDS